MFSKTITYITWYFKMSHYFPLGKKVKELWKVVRGGEDMGERETRSGRDVN